MTWSVVIPTRNRPDRLERVLALLAPQQPDEIIVTDDGAPAPPHWLAAQYPDVTYLPGPRRGPAANRNHGARAATCQWLVFLDDDCEPAATWLGGYKAAASESLDAIEGRTECPREDAFVFREVVENLEGGAWWSCNFAVRREFFLAMGGFDEEFTEACAEDMEFAWRLRARDALTTFAREAAAIHPPRPMNLQALLRRAASHRWMLLYRIKTGRDRGIVATELLDTARMTWHLLSQTARPYWRERAMHLLWRCISLPLFLPYYARWRAAYRASRARRAA